MCVGVTAGPAKRRAQVELALNLKMVLDNWNMQTQAWLKYVCYDRVKTAAVWKTMMLSAVWSVAHAA